MQTQESLASQLASYKAGCIGRAPAARIAMMEAAISRSKSRKQRSSIHAGLRRTNLKTTRNKVENNFLWNCRCAQV